VHTKDILAAALRDADLPLMALKAAEGYYHDYLSPLAMPEKQLVSELTIIGTSAALALCERVKNGDYGASEEEEEAWVSSPDGLAAMQALAAKSKDQGRQRQCVAREPKGGQDQGEERALSGCQGESPRDLGAR
jgi:hypothetical protein